MANATLIAFDTAGNWVRIRNRLGTDLTSAEPLTQSEITAIKGTLALTPVTTNVKDFGARGDGETDDTAAINTAIEYVNAQGFGAVYFPPGTYKVNGQITVLDGVELLGESRESVTIDMSESTATGSFIIAAGSVTALPALGAQINKGDLSVQFATAPELSVGDIYMIYSTDNTSFSSSGYQGEFFKVAAVDGTTVTNQGGGSYDDYAVGADKVLAKVNPIRTSVKRMKIVFKEGVTVRGFRLDYGLDCVFEDVHLSGSRWANLAIYRSYNTSLTRLVAEDNQASVGLNYGVMHMHSQGTRAEKCHIATSRHGWATGGDEVAPVNRDIRISNSYIASSQRISYGLDFHRNTEFATVENCTLPNGVDWDCDWVTLRGNTIRGNVNQGEALYVGPEWGSNMVIENNEIHAEKDFTGSVGTALVRIFTVATTKPGKILIRNNKVFMYSFVHPTSTYGILVSQTVAGGGDTDVQVEIEDNKVYSTKTSATALDHWGIYVAPAPNFGFKRISLNRNKTYGTGVRVLGNAREIAIRFGETRDALRDGIWISPLTSPSFASQEWIIEGNDVRGSLRAGIFAQGNQSGETVRMLRNTSLNNGVDGTQSSGFRVSLNLSSIASGHVEGNFVGDTAASPTQAFIARFGSVTSLTRADNKNLGAGVNSLVDSLASVTSGKVVGSGGGEIATKTAAYTATPFDHTILCDTTAAGFTVTLPPAAQVAGKILVVKKVSVDANTLTVDGNAAETIDGTATKTTSTQWETFRLQSTGTGWVLI